MFKRENVIVNITGDAAALAAATEGEGGDALRSLLGAVPVGEEAAVSAAAAAAEGELFKADFRSRGFDREPNWVKEIRDGKLLHADVKDALLIPTKVRDDKKEHKRRTSHFSYCQMPLLLQ